MIHATAGEPLNWWMGGWQNTAGTWDGAIQPWGWVRPPPVVAANATTAPARGACRRCWRLLKHCMGFHCPMAKVFTQLPIRPGFWQLKRASRLMARLRNPCQLWRQRQQRRRRQWSHVASA